MFCSVALNEAAPRLKTIVLGENRFWLLGENLEGGPPVAVQTTVKEKGPPPGVAFTVGLAQLTVTGLGATRMEMEAGAVPEKRSLQLELVQI